MPVATVTQPTRRYELKTCPDGYVVIKRMNHGQKLRRQDMSSKMRIDTNRKSKNAAAEIDMLQETVTRWEFQNLIVEHNLTDENNRALDFRRESDIDLLDGMVAEEISTYIDEMNNFEPDAADSDSPLGSSSDASEPAS